MAISFPVPLADFFGRLRIAELVLAPTDPTVISRTRGGEVLAAQIGNVLWSGSVALSRAHHGEAAAVQAMLALLRRSGGSFMASPVQRRGPLLDPEGALLGAATPQIHIVEANNRDIRIQNLPAGYTLSPGDYLSFTYGGAPLRYAFHQLVTGAIANGSGVTPVFEVTPPIRAGITLPATVKLVDPAFKAVLVSTPGYGAFHRVFADGLSFDFVQTLS